MTKNSRREKYQEKYGYGDISHNYQTIMEVEKIKVGDFICGSKLQLKIFLKNNPMKKILLTLFVTLILLDISGCGQSDEEIRVIKRQRIISQLNIADAQLVDGRNKLDSLLREKDSDYLRDVLNKIDNGIDTLQKVEREL